MKQALVGLLWRDLALARREAGELALALAFFPLMALLFPLALGPELALLRRLAPGVLMVGALLTALLTLERPLAEDAKDGTLDFLLLSPAPLELLVLAKALAHWLTAGFPLLLAAPLLTLFYGLPMALLPVALAAVLLATLGLSLLGTAVTALALGARRASLLLPLLLLPLAVPLLIFGAGALTAGLEGLPVLPHLLLGLAACFLALPLAALGGAAALRSLA